MKRILIVFFIFLSSSPCFALEISEKISDWHLTNEYIQPLIPDATSEDMGRVIYKTYEREAPRGTLEIILTEGTGTGSLYIPDEIKKSKGLMPANEYKIFEINSRKAILENQSYLPLAIAIDVADNVILTIESPSLNQDELIKIAEEILSSWNFIKSD
ncbi:MAG: hypothetical protein IKN30_08260 [Synergistaceae bacterium]|nr:hypothetical protein [Synergistaceae bacterium]